MLIAVQGFGRLGNRLFLSAHLRAFCLKYGIPFEDWAMAPYGHWFPSLETPKGRLPFALRWLQERLPWSVRFQNWTGETVNFDLLTPPKLLEPLQRGRDVFYQGWLFRGYESLAVYRPEILRLFRPAPAVVDAADRFWSRFFSAEDTVVGVHVRWEDYRGTANFIPLPGFLEAMESVKRLLAGKQVRFLIFSNESLDEGSFSGFDAVLSRCNPAEDLTLMSRCQYLVGPPSTFSGWASFYGAVPLCTLESGQGALSLANFSVAKG
jgi:hypothetical protein